MFTETNSIDSSCEYTCTCITHLVSVELKVKVLVEIGTLVLVIECSIGG